jgi:hypothetical protein
MFMHVFAQAVHECRAAGNHMKFGLARPRAAALREDGLAWVPVSSPKSEAWLDSGREVVG